MAGSEQPQEEQLGAPRHHEEGRPTDASTTQARQGVTLGRMRYVLGFGIGLLVLAFILAYLVGAPM